MRSLGVGRCHGNGPRCAARESKESGDESFEETRSKVDAVSYPECDRAETQNVWQDGHTVDMSTEKIKQKIMGGKPGFKRKEE